jgi:hypothetical protein
VPDTPDTIIPEDDRLGDLNPPTVNYNYGPGEELDIDQPIMETLKQTLDPVVTPEQLIDDQGPCQQVKPDPTQPPEQIVTKVLDQGATGLRARLKPQRLVQIFGSKSSEGTAAIATHLIHPNEHMDPNYVLVTHLTMFQFSMKAGLRRFKEHGEEAVSKELYQLHFRDMYEPINPKELSKQERQQVLESHLFLKEK